MARNEEKAGFALNRWVKQKKDVDDGTFFGNKRPRLAEECEDLKECIKWRHQVVREISKKVAEIQNASLGEHRIRDLNDEINKHLREKVHWEAQIKKLGGPDFAAQGKTADSFGQELSGQAGYKYFGAAKDLPGVRELFEREENIDPTRKTRKTLYKCILPDYYGWRDEEDGLLVLAEQEAEMVAEKRAKIEFIKERAAKVDENKDKPPEVITNNFTGKSFVSIPDHADIQKLILQKKKQQLLDKYVTPEEQVREEKTRELRPEG